MDLVFYLLISLVMFLCLDIEQKARKEVVLVLMLGIFICLLPLKQTLQEIIVLELLISAFYQVATTHYITEIIFYGAFLLLSKDLVSLLPSIFLSIMAFIIIVGLMLFVKKRYPLSDNNLYWGLLAFVALSSCLIFAILYYDFLAVLGINRKIIIILVLLVTIFISYYLFLKYSKLNNEQLLLQQALSQFKNNQQINEYLQRKNQELSKLKHDLTYDYLLMKQALKDNDSAIDKTINQKLTTLKQDNDLIITNYPLFDAFVNLKLDYAHLQQFKITTLITINDLSFIEDQHLNMIIDYAFEVAFTSAQTIKEITFKALQDKTILEIDFIIYQGKIISTNQLKALKLIIKQYHGSLIYEIKDKNVYLSILIPNQPN